MLWLILQDKNCLPLTAEGFYLEGTRRMQRADTWRYVLRKNWLENCINFHPRPSLPLLTGKRPDTNGSTVISHSLYLTRKWDEATGSIGGGGWMQFWVRIRWEWRCMRDSFWNIVQLNSLSCDMCIIWEYLLIDPDFSEWHLRVFECYYETHFCVGFVFCDWLQNLLWNKNDV